MKHRLGLVSVSFRSYAPEEIITAMKECGLDAIEWGSDIHAPANEIKKIKDAAKLQKEYGVTCSSYGTYFRLGETPISELPSYIAAAKLLGTDILRLWCGNKSGDATDEAEKALLISVCKEAARIAEREGVTLCMECHINTYTNTKESALELINKVKINHKTFLKALPVFVVCVVIAFIMNIIFHSTGNTNSFNMFYIGPYNKCDIPILNTIGSALNIASKNLHFGNFVFILIYIVGFSIAAYLILLASMLINKIHCKYNKKTTKKYNSKKS